MDDALVRKKFDTQEEIFEMNNGCICCTVRGDLIRILGKILKKGKMDAIIIETTGLADPAPVAQTFFMDEKIKALARIDGILTVVDAKHIIQHLDEEKPEGVENEAVEQVAFADRLLINKWYVSFFVLSPAATVVNIHPTTVYSNNNDQRLHAEKCGALCMHTNHGPRTTPMHKKWVHLQTSLNHSRPTKMCPSSFRDQKSKISTKTLTIATLFPPPPFLPVIWSRKITSV